jgi:hypothetical protein
MRSGPDFPGQLVIEKKEQNMMRSLRLGVIGLLGSAAWLGVGCDSGSSSGPEQRPIDSTEATAALNQHVDDLLRGLADSTAALDMTDSTTVATGAVNSATGSSSTSSATGSIDDLPKSTAKTLDELLHKAVQEAKDHVFREEFVESKDGNKVVYKVDPAAVCDTNSECLQKLTANPVRFAVTANTDDSLNVTLLVGQDQHSPATALLSSQKLSVRADLAEILAVIRLFANAQDQQNFPDLLDGVVEYSIEKLGDHEFAISAAVIEKVDVKVGQAKGKPVEVTLQPSNPTMELTINAATNTLGYALNYGAVDVKVAGAAVCGSDSKCGDKEKNGTFSGHLGGYSAGFTVSKGAEALTVSNLGLGNDTAYVALNNDRLGTLDINPKDGRKFSMTFKKTAEGTLVTFDPALDIKLAIMLNKLSDSLKVDMPAWLSNEIFEVMLGGAATPSVLVPTAASDTGGNKSQLKVVNGKLSLSESSLSSPVEVAAGMCLGAADAADGDVPPFSLFSANVCQ